MAAILANALLKVSLSLIDVATSQAVYEFGALAVKLARSRCLCIPTTGKLA
jgi:hypothetical protein